MPKYYGTPEWNTLLQRIKNNDTTLTLLDFTFDEIGATGAHDLSLALKDNYTLTFLDLSFNVIREVGAQLLSFALKDKHALTFLDLKLNLIGEVGTQALSLALQDHQALTFLGLRLNHIGVAGAQALSLALKDKHALTSLDLSCNKIGDVGIQALSLALQEHQALTSLNLTSNNIGAAGAQALSLALQALTSLNLKSNNIGAAGAQVLSLALKDNHSLTSLELGNNKIGAAGAQVLSLALQNNHTLTSLYLSSNEIGDTGTQALSLALQHNHSLTDLSLGWNKIGETGAQALSLALQDNHTLTSLKLNNNKIGAAGAQVLNLALQDNYTLTSLDLENNDIEATEKKAIEQSLTNNKCLRDQLVQAVKIGQTQMIATLRQQGVGLFSEPDYSGYTLLHWAIVSRQPNSLNALRALTTPQQWQHLLKLVDKDKRTPLALAQHLNAVDLIELLQPQHVIVLAPLSRPKPDTEVKASNPLQTNGQMSLSEVEEAQALVEEPSQRPLLEAKLDLGQIQACLQEAESQKAAQDYPAAMAQCLAILAQDPSHPAALHLYSECVEAKSEQSKRKALRTQEKLAPLLPKDIEIRFSDVGLDPENPGKTGQLIGRGSYGSVYKTTYQGSVVAVKVINKLELSEAEALEFQNESTIMAALRFPNIVSFYGICSEKRPYCIVMEYCARGRLNRVVIDDWWEIRQESGWTTTLADWSQRVRLACDVTAGLSFLRQHHIVHGDLKGENILVDANMNCKISDFGTSRYSEGSQTLTGGGMQGTVLYMAPEVLVDNQKPSFQSDIYSFGVVLFEIACQTFPYAKHMFNDNRSQIVYQDLKAGRREAVTDHCQKQIPQLAKLIRWCWEKDPNKRPMLKDINAVLQDATLLSQVTEEPKEPEKEEGFLSKMRHRLFG